MTSFLKELAKEASVPAAAEVPEAAPAPAKMAVEHLNLFYGDFQGLRDINLTFPENQVTALIGPSGCGKSTLLKTLNRMNDLVEGCRVEGSVLLDGADAYRTLDATDLRRRVGMVFQQPNPFPMSIYDNVAFGPRSHGVRAKAELDIIVEESLRAAAIWDELKDRLKKNALGLSGGQQQRLCIARALAVQPEVLLLDESTSALDPISTAKIEELIGQLKERYTVIMVTHNMLQALRISDKTAFFLLGEVVEAGDTDTIFSAPTDPRTADYVAGRFGSRISGCRSALPGTALAGGLRSHGKRGATKVAPYGGLGLTVGSAARFYFHFTWLLRRLLNGASYSFPAEMSAGRKGATRQRTRLARGGSP